MKYKIVAIGSDHAGFALKSDIIDMLKSENIVVQDFGTDSDQSVDYPDHVHPLASAIESGKAECGILICGSGNGVAMAANKHSGIRAALCWNEELAVLARKHNDANIICLPARFVSKDLAIKMIAKFLSTDFEGGRHAQRVEKIANYVTIQFPDKINE